MLPEIADLYSCRSERQTMVIPDTTLAVVKRDESRFVVGYKVFE
jgi:hypothetical protein